MSWNDPCSGCGNPRYDCECKREPPTMEQKERWEEERLQREKNKREICDVVGHDWKYTFIIYECKRCAETSDY